ncbi:MAG: HDIG domain-containing protein [Chthoniobacterales bacterium]|nr:HDIG domain-containing protein [Chthoniobacterales bacterium]
MVKYLEQRQLAARGLTCGKIRRRIRGHQFLRALEKGWGIRLLTLALILTSLFGIMLLGKEQLSSQQCLVALSLFTIALGGLWIGHPTTAYSNSRLTLLFGTLIAQLALVKTAILITNAGIMDPKLVPLLLPYALAPLTLSVLLGNRDALFALLFGSCWGGFLFNNFQEINIPFLLISLLAGFIAMIATQQVRRRSRLIRAGIYVGITTWILAIMLGEIAIASPFTKSDGMMILLQSVGALASGIVTSIIVSGLLPILEYLFSVTTEISWLEMADLNHPLLRRLSLEAPGTYQHSIAVATLAEAAAEAIHANASICRVGAYFHDIGKLVKPEYFTENTSSDFNPHDNLTPTMSSLIITAHVKEGIDLALKNKLHRRIVDIISQHHGTTMVSYFFERARQQQEDVRLGGKMLNLREEDIPEVHEETFRYPGPKLQTKEAVVVSLADLAESATHSMEKPSRQRIDDLLQSVFKERLQQGEYNECPITVGELHKIVETLVNTLAGMMHTRVAYKKTN